MTRHKDAFKMPYQELENEDEFVSFHKNKSSEEPEHKKDIIHRLSEHEVQEQQPAAELGYD